MTSQERSLKEYRSRINRVMDYLETNLDKPADLDMLAGIASFSPYHFHRIFTAMTGETPGSFQQRLRLERAARLLRKNGDTPISETAFMCGFSDPSSFSRAFRKCFGMTAMEYRMQEEPIFVRDGHRFGKNSQPLSKDGTVIPGEDHQFCGVELKNLIFMDTKIEIKQLPEMKVIYVRHTGAFNEIGKAYEKLCKWAGPRGLMKPGTKTVTVYHDDPAVTSIEKVRQSACLIVDEDVKVEDEIGKMTIPAASYAVGGFTIGVDGFEKAWNTMCHWFTESGYQPGEGNPMELYHEDKGTYPDITFVLDICIPVKPL